MKTKFTRLGAVAATLAAATVATLGLGGSTGAFAGPPLGTNTLTPSNGSTATPSFSMIPPSGASCTGSGAGTPSYRWQTFIADAGVDASTLTYASGPVAVAGHFVSTLYDSAGGTPVQNQNPSATPLGLISGIPTFSFASLAGAPGLTAGAYNIGFACTQAGALDAGKYWSTPITISNVTATSFNYAFGAVPAAPVLGALTPGDTTLAGSFTAAASTPATTGFTVTAHPSAGADVTLPVAAAGAFTLTGLTNGTSYAVSVTATNPTGTSAPSNTFSGTPTPAARPPVTGLAESQTPLGSTTATLSWTAPTGTAPTGYGITVSPSLPGSPFTAAAGATSFPIPGGTIGTTYTATVTPTHPSPFVGASAPVTYTLNAAQVIVQDITVTRPAGVLVLTQRCGVYGALDAVTDTGDGFGALAAVAASGGTIGTAPTTGGSAGGPADPGFPQYPNPSPAAYPTHCGINLGTASLVTSGANAGAYYAATGQINQVTVLNTIDSDSGYTVNGVMGSFTSVGDSFSGKFLGWEPKVNYVSPSTGTYTHTVNASAIVAPNTPGLGTPAPLAVGPAAHSIGVASMDARLKLLIPTTAKAGTYTGTLTFTVA